MTESFQILSLIKERRRLHLVNMKPADGTRGPNIPRQELTFEKVLKMWCTNSSGIKSSHKSWQSVCWWEASEGCGPRHLAMFQLSDSTRSPSEEKLDQVYFTVFYLENVEFDLKSGWKDLQVSACQHECDCGNAGWWFVTVWIFS